MKIKIDYSENTRHIFLPFGRYGHPFPSPRTCEACQGTGVGYAEPETRDEPAISERCEDCEGAGSILNPTVKVRKRSKSSIRRLAGAA